MAVFETRFSRTKSFDQEQFHAARLLWLAPMMVASLEASEMESVGASKQHQRFEGENSTCYRRALAVAHTVFGVSPV